MESHYISCIYCNPEGVVRVKFKFNFTLLQNRFKTMWTHHIVSVGPRLYLHNKDYGIRLRQLRQFTNKNSDYNANL